MPKTWLDTNSYNEAQEFGEDFWVAMRQGIDTGAFWADRIKQYRNEPGKRLEEAIAHIPLPAAFEHAAVALRAIIRSKRKLSEPYANELGLLYWIAAVNSFTLPYAERLKQPGYNVIASIPGERIRALSVDYRTLGYSKLNLLTKTDIKWLIATHGEPQSHATLNQLHRALWDEYENKLIEQERERTERFKQELRELLGNSPKQPTPPARPNPNVRRPAGCFKIVACIMLILLFSVFASRA